MKIQIFTPEGYLNAESLKAIESGIKQEHPSFSWEVVSLPSLGSLAVSQHSSLDGVIRVNAGFPASSDAPFSSDFFTLTWPLPEQIIKDSDVKLRVWKEVQEILIPGFLSNPAVEVPKLSFTANELQELLKKLSKSKAPFTLTTSSGLKVGVNSTLPGLDLTLDTGDIASMLAASWIFGSSGVTIPKDSSDRKSSY